MAKVTITMEDKKDEEGNDGLIIGWDSDDVENEKSLANRYAEVFINNVASQGESVTDLTHELPNHNEEMN